MRYALALSALLLFAVAFAAGGAGAQRSGSEFATIGDTRDALTLALSQQRLAQRRAEQLEAAAASATEQVEQTRAEAAALASRLQETEAGLAAAGARVAIADLQYGAIRGRIAERQRPLIGLTATLQNFTRRPVAIAVLRPGSLRETVYTRAILASALPELRRRTEGLRSELEEAAELRQQAVSARSSLARLETQLPAGANLLAFGHVYGQCLETLVDEAMYGGPELLTQGVPHRCWRPGAVNLGQSIALGLHTSEKSSLPVRARQPWSQAFRLELVAQLF